MAWLFIWPYQLPWYDAIFVCVLVLSPATRLDWLVLLRLTVATISNTPGIPAGLPGHVLKTLDFYAIHYVTPAALLAAVAGLAVLAVSGRWGVRYPPRRAAITAPAGAGGSGRAGHAGDDSGTAATSAAPAGTGRGLS